MSAQTISVGRVQSAASNSRRPRSTAGRISRGQSVGGLTSGLVYIGLPAAGIDRHSRSARTRFKRPPARVVLAGWRQNVGNQLDTGPQPSAVVYLWRSVRNGHLRFQSKKARFRPDGSPPCGMSVLVHFVEMVIDQHAVDQRPESHADFRHPGNCCCAAGPDIAA
jgi:hypothetical protein